LEENQNKSKNILNKVILGQREIVEGISRILGLQSYIDLEDDLRTLYQQKIPKVYNSSSSETERRLMDITADIQKSEGYLRSYDTEQTDLTTELRDVDGQLLEVEDQLRSVGAIDPKQIERAQARRIEVTTTLKALESALEKAWDSAMPLGLLGPLRQQLNEALQGEERFRSWESAKTSVEPKIPQVRDQVFSSPPNDVALDDTRLKFYTDRLEKALLGLFNPPPEGIPQSAFIVDRNDLSAQIRGKLFESTSAITELAAVCSELDRLDNEARQLDSELRKFTQDKGAVERGNVLREERGKLIQRKDTIEKRLQDLKSEAATLADKVTELKREETVLSEIVRKSKEGRTLGVMAQQYRDVNGG
jgi:chromosome segregation ATPase